MIEVEVLVDSFKDKENFYKEVKVIRNGNEMNLIGKLLLKGDIYFITKERFNELAPKGIVAKVKKEKSE